MRRRQALAGTAIAAASWALASGPERALAAGADRAPIRLGQSAPVSGPLAPCSRMRTRWAASPAAGWSW